MSQSTVIKYLEQHSSKENPKTCKEINKALKVNSGCSLARLRKHGEVFFKKTKNKKGNTMFLYWSKENASK